jgi:hypothetical protein
MRRPTHKTALAAVLITATAAFGAAGCGGSDSGAISSDDATTAIAKAAGVTLKADKIPGDAQKEGLKASASNTTTAGKDQQMVFVFTLKDNDTVGKLKDGLKNVVPAGSAADIKVLTHENIVVIYGNVGKDRSADVQKALDGLS